MSASVENLVSLVFELRYEVASLALRCKRAGIAVDKVTLTHNDEDFLLRETEEVLLRHADPALRGAVSLAAARQLEALRKAAAATEPDGGE